MKKRGATPDSFGGSPSSSIHYHKLTKTDDGFVDMQVTVILRRNLFSSS